MSLFDSDLVVPNKVNYSVIEDFPSLVEILQISSSHSVGRVYVAAALLTQAPERLRLGTDSSSGSSASSKCKGQS